MKEIGILIVGITIGMIGIHAYNYCIYCEENTEVCKPLTIEQEISYCDSRMRSTSNYDTIRYYKQKKELLIFEMLHK